MARTPVPRYAALADRLDGAATARQLERWCQNGWGPVASGPSDAVAGAHYAALVEVVAERHHSAVVPMVLALRGYACPELSASVRAAKALALPEPARAEPSADEPGCRGDPEGLAAGRIEESAAPSSLLANILAVVSHGVDGSRPAWLSEGALSIDTRGLVVTLLAAVLAVTWGAGADSIDDDDLDRLGSSWLAGVVLLMGAVDGFDDLVGSASPEALVRAVKVADRLADARDIMRPAQHTTRERWGFVAGLVPLVLVTGALLQAIPDGPSLAALAGSAQSPAPAN